MDAATGRDVWRQELPTPFFVFKWGPGMSPVLYRDLVVLCQDDDLFPAIYAFDKVSGRVRWHDDRLDMAVNYSHPIVCMSTAVTIIVVAGTGMLIGYDPDRAAVVARQGAAAEHENDAGRRGWRHLCIGAKRWDRQSVDRLRRSAPTGNNDNKLDKAEIQAFVGTQKIPEAFFTKTFGRGDLNHDGSWKDVSWT